MADLATVEGGQKGVIVNQGTATGVDDARPFGQQGESVAVQCIFGRGGVWQQQRPPTTASIGKSKPANSPK